MFAYFIFLLYVFAFYYVSLFCSSVFCTHFCKHFESLNSGKKAEKCTWTIIVLHPFLQFGLYLHVGKVPCWVSQCSVVVCRESRPPTLHSFVVRELSTHPDVYLCRRIAMETYIRQRQLIMSPLIPSRVIGENEPLTAVFNKVIATREVNHKGQGK